LSREDIAKRLGIGVASVYRVLASTAPRAPAPDALSLARALARNPRFVVHKPRGQGFIIGQR
jgi:hypothetical protein